MKIINIRMIIFAINKHVSVYKFFYHNLFSQIKISRHDASAQKVRDEHPAYGEDDFCPMCLERESIGDSCLACTPNRRCS